MFRYYGPFVLLLSVPLLFYAFGPAAPFLTIAALLVALGGAEFIAPRANTPEAVTPPRHFRALPLLYIPFQLGVIGWATIMASRASLPMTGFAGLVLSVGLTAGVFGMLAAHELVHGSNRTEHLFAASMLTAMTYRHFRVAHVHGHHRWAGTARDPATARLGEGFYAFLIRTLAGQFRDAWRFEARRCANNGHWWSNRTATDVAISAGLLALIFAVLGMCATLFFALQSAVAIVVLELFNYIAHYGLQRRVQSGGEFEAMDDRHSWNSSNMLANALIFNMGRHSYHHRRPALPYQNLQRRAAAPELPAGYAGSILLALVPPLWRRVMDPKVAALP